MVVVVMGVTGAGKTTVGTALAAALGWKFLDADTLHPPANVAKMRAGVPLTDADRAPWLDAVRAAIARALDRRESVVVACSALTDRYRERLGAGTRGIRLVHLDVPQHVAAARAAARPGHFAGAALVPSQFAVLEPPPPNALVVDGTAPPDSIIANVRQAFGV